MEWPRLPGFAFFSARYPAFPLDRLGKNGGITWRGEKERSVSRIQTDSLAERENGCARRRELQLLLLLLLLAVVDCHSIMRTEEATPTAPLFTS